MERCAEWLGLARGLFHITYLKRKKKKYIKKIKIKKIYIKKKTEKKRKKKTEILRIDRENLRSILGTFFGYILFIL